MNIAKLEQVVQSVIQKTGSAFIESIELPSKLASFSKIPERLSMPIKKRLLSMYSRGLYSHQSIAIEAGLNGASLCVVTPTASGKSTIFTSITLSTLLDEPGTVALALYPAKALIHDQEKKWREMSAGTGIKSCIIHGGVQKGSRIEMIKRSRIVLMTPDVLHAWLLSDIGNPEIKKFLATLRIVVLDESHVYDGVFGTNMAYLMRRLRAISGFSQLLASSATIGDPLIFVQRLTGIQCQLIGVEQDGTATHKKKIIHCVLPKTLVSRFLKTFIEDLSGPELGKFLFFVDSRKRVEELASSTYYSEPSSSTELNTDAITDGEDSIDENHIIDLSSNKKILPYRGGYEEADRSEIQTALTDGTLRGVISTSALELGIDIGEISLILNLGIPLTTKSFWQRAGRAGRKGESLVVLMDVDGILAKSGLRQYLARQPESNWLYLDNEYLQYSNALCASDEILQWSKVLYSKECLSDLPDNFHSLLENEISPTRPIPHELYPLKQQSLAAGNPHYAFPIRTSIEKSYQVECQNSPQSLGSLTYSQLLREAFPGAIYRYFGRPYRIWSVKHPTGKILAQNVSKTFALTRATSQTMVFPQFTDEVFYLAKAEDGFICESKLQVSHRVIGFVEQNGKTKTEIKYDHDCQYSNRPLLNYYDTTGVCFYFRADNLQSEKIGRYIAIAFCRLCGVQERDVGTGAFQSNLSPIGQEQIKGFAVFDSVVGSLRLTKLLPQKLKEILEEAIRMAKDEEANKIAGNLLSVLKLLPSLHVVNVTDNLGNVFGPGADEGWISVIGKGQKAICHDGNSHINEEVTVLGYVYTPQGIRYSLESPRAGVAWQVTASMIHPIHGITKMEQYNLNTGDIKQ